MDPEQIRAASERLGSESPVPETNAAFLERAWEISREIPVERRATTAIGLGAITGGRSDDPIFHDPERFVAYMTRSALLYALVERGVLDQYMSDETLRGKVFRAAAAMPCNKNDLSEALVGRALRESSPEDAAKMREEMAQAGFDPDNPPVIQKLIDWMKQV